MSMIPFAAPAGMRILVLVTNARYAWDVVFTAVTQKEFAIHKGHATKQVVQEYPCGTEPLKHTYDVSAHQAVYQFPEDSLVWRDGKWVAFYD